MATNKNIKIKFTSDFSTNKKGNVKEFSRDIVNIFVNELKVAELFSEEKKAVKQKKTK
jgi:hypothetical protein